MVVRCRHRHKGYIAWGITTLMGVNDAEFSEHVAGDAGAYARWCASEDGAASFRLAAARFDRELISFGALRILLKSTLSCLRAQISRARVLACGERKHSSGAGVNSKHATRVLKQAAGRMLADAVMARRREVWQVLSNTALTPALAMTDVFTHRDPDTLLMNGAALRMYKLGTKTELAQRPSWLKYGALSKTLPRMAFLEARAARCVLMRASDGLPVVRR